MATTKSTTKPRKTRPWTALKRLLDMDGAWTHERLAEATGYSKPYVTLLINGHRQPTRDAIARFAELLKVPKTMLEPRHTEIRYAYRLDEVAEMIGLPEDAVLRLVTSGELTAKSVDGTLLVPDAALTAFFSAHADDVPQPRGPERAA
jgi:transcriptional regulator with XRE-family HTH domain